MTAIPSVAAIAELERIVGASGRLPPPPKAAEKPMRTMKNQIPAMLSGPMTSGKPTMKPMKLVAANKATRMNFLLIGSRSDHAPESGFMMNPMSVMIEVMKPAVPASKPMEER